MELPQRGDIVLSLKGRDAGRMFFVLDTMGDYISLADGRIRPLERLKKKKLKHTRWLMRPAGHVPDKLRAGARVTNKEIRRTIAFILETEDMNGQG